MATPPCDRLVRVGQVFSWRTHRADITPLHISIEILINSDAAYKKQTESRAEAAVS